jgi:hypothetical protein
MHRLNGLSVQSFACPFSTHAVSRRWPASLPSALPLRLASPTVAGLSQEPNGYTLLAENSKGNLAAPQPHRASANLG